MMPVIVGVLVAVRHRLVAVLMPVVSMGLRFVGVLVLMFVFAVAAHLDSPPISWPASFF
jgi:hypothetical protein